MTSPSQHHDTAKTDLQAPRRSRGLAMVRYAPAWLVSMLLHVVVLLSLALVVTATPEPEVVRIIESTAADATAEPEELRDVELPTPDESPMKELVEESTVSPDNVAVEPVDVASEAADVSASEVSVEITDITSANKVSSSLVTTVGLSGGSAAGFGGRMSAKTQAAMIRSGGGDPEPVIKAVETSVDWFKRHQMPDGGWSFDFRQCPSCKGKCENPHHDTHINDRTAATALVLLPMLGQGYTHKALGEKGKHRQVMEKGLAFLAAQAIQGKGKLYGGPNGGNMYSQGLAAIVLCEAYGMTKDDRLVPPAQAAIEFIMASQDPVGGGWRYAPKQAGDTSAVCWQVMALKSARMSGLRVDPYVVKKVSTFLDSVQADGGAAYGYTDAKTARPPLNAAGLLCRMFTDWKKTNDALLRGAKTLAASPPSKDMYHVYYATQVLYHVKQQLPKEWDSWQKRVSDMLVASQIKSGHQSGAYFEGFERSHAAQVGGIIYVTSMATMTLEVYFKHGLPLYQEAAAQTDDFAE